MAVHRPRHRGRCRLGQVDRVPAAEQLGQPRPHAGQRQVGDRGQRPGAGHHPRVRSARSDVGRSPRMAADQPAEHRARSSLDEDPGAVGVHGLDLLGEPHRRADLRGRARHRSRPGRPGTAPRSGWTTPAAPARAARSGRPAPANPHPRRRPPGCGTRTPPGSARAAIPASASCRAASAHRVASGPEITSLAGRVLVGHDHRRRSLRSTRATSRVGGRPRPSCRGRRPAASRIASARAALSASSVLGVEGAGRAQRDQLAVAVAGQQVRLDAQPGAAVVGRQPGDAERGLGDPGVAQPVPLRRGRLGVEGGRREHQLGPRAPSSSRSLQLGEGDEQIGQHAAALAALAGEQAARPGGVGVGCVGARPDARRTPSAECASSSRSPATKATEPRARGAVEPRAAAANARSRSRAGRRRASAAGRAAERRRRRSAPRNANSSAGQACAPCRGAGPGVPGEHRRGSWCRRNRTR